ncbi:MAG: hypothetical protein M3384_11090 [Acidobacteriota bacterium]|nr:hypothetical protein [Acidobacteriota bacterium]
MKQVFINKFKALLAIAFSISVVWGTALAQEETEPARSSNLVGSALPANAQRVSPQSVPAEINDTLDKIVAGGEGKVRRGGTEVLVWAGAGYKKANAAQISGQLQNNWKADGWTFEAGGEQDGVTLFSLIKTGGETRAVIGFYGATDEAFILAITELLKAEGGSANVSSGEQSRNTQTDPQIRVEEPARQTSVQSSTGVTLRDLVGKWEKKSTMGGRVNANTGVYLGSSGNYESYEFAADGSVAYSSLISVQQGACNLSAFSQSRGRASVSGSEMTISLGAGTIDRKDTCNASGDYKRATKATGFTYEWTVGKDEYGVTQLTLTQSNGEKYYYRKVK